VCANLCKFVCALCKCAIVPVCASLCKFVRALCSCRAGLREPLHGMLFERRLSLCRVACRPSFSIRVSNEAQARAVQKQGKTEWATEGNARAERLVALIRTCVFNGLYARAVQKQGKTEWATEENACAERLVALFCTCVLNGLYACAVQDQGRQNGQQRKTLVQSGLSHFFAPAC